MPHTITVGMAQMQVEPGQTRANLDRAVHYIGEAARQSCDVVVLPECLDLGWGDSSAKSLAQPIPGAHTARLAAAASAHGIFVAAGLVERHDGQLFNAAVLIDDCGHTVLHHRKIHELQNVTGHLYGTGQQIAVAKTRLGLIGLNICADNAPESLAIGHAIALMGAQLLLCPCAWAVPPDHDNQRTPYGDLWLKAYGELARTHGMPTVGVSSVGTLREGPWAGWPVIGASLAMAGDRTPALRGSYGQDAEELRCVTLQLRPSAARNETH